MNKIIILVAGLALIYLSASGRLQAVWAALTEATKTPVQPSGG